MEEVSAMKKAELDMDGILTNLGYSIELREDGKYINGVKVMPFEDWAVWFTAHLMRCVECPMNDTMVSYYGLRTNAGSPISLKKALANAENT